VAVPDAEEQTFTLSLARAHRALKVKKDETIIDALARSASTCPSRACRASASPAPTATGWRSTY